VLGGVCRETNDNFLYVVPAVSPEILVAKINLTVRPGTIITMPLSYASEKLIRQLQGANYTINVLEDNEHLLLRKVELALKLGKKPCFHIHNNMGSYLCEYMWRERLNGKDPFEQILVDIARYKKG